MGKSLVVVYPEHALDLAEKLHGPHVQRAIVVGGELGQILEDLGLGVYFAARLDPLEAVIQKGGDYLPVALCESVYQAPVRLTERRRVIGSGKRLAREDKHPYSKHQTGGECVCEEAFHCCLLPSLLESCLVWQYDPEPFYSVRPVLSHYSS
jgi:hypothetical protein